jgi:hypothetical protein
MCVIILHDRTWVVSRRRLFPCTKWFTSVISTILLWRGWAERWSSADRPGHCRDPIRSCSEQRVRTILSLVCYKLCFSRRV